MNFVFNNKKIICLCIILFGFYISNVNVYAENVLSMNISNFVNPKDIGIELQYQSNPNHYAFNDIYVDFDPHNLTYPSFAESFEIEAILPKGMRGLGYSYELAEELYGVNSLFLIGLTRLESANGTSKLAIERNNISGFTAYDGSVNKHSTYFDSKHECIIKTAKWISEEYLSDDGKYYNGLSLWDINKNYASDSKWSNKINNIISKMIKDGV